MKYISFLILFLSLFTSMFGQIQLDSEFPNAWEKKKTIDCIVLLHSKPSFRKDLHKLDKIEKTHHVYNSLIENSKKSQKEIIALFQSHKLSYQSFYIVNALKVKLNLETFLALTSMKEVKAILIDKPMKMLEKEIKEVESISSRAVEPEWGLKKIKADSVWMQGIIGEGAVVGGLDTGIDWAVSPLKSKYRGYQDSSNVDHNYHWHDAIHQNSPLSNDTIPNPCGYNTIAPCDDNSHGTHTVGTMVGSDSSNIIGVALDAKWIGCRNMERGNGSPSTYLECFEWMLAPTNSLGQNPRPELAPDVINNSYYCSTSEGCDSINIFLFRDAIINLKAAGIFVAISAGNFGADCGRINSVPALFKESFAVGATNVEDRIAGFSSAGPVRLKNDVFLKPNVTAPGVNVRSVIRGGGFANFGGTSMAGPHVAGAVALIVSGFPQLRGKVTLLEEILQMSADTLHGSLNCDTFLGSQVPNVVFGYGRINVLRAVEMARQIVKAETNEEQTLNQIGIYPNPTNQLLTIQSPLSPLICVEIHNIDGQKVETNNYVGDERIIYQHVGHLIAGVYICSIHTEKGVKSLRFIKS